MKNIMVYPLQALKLDPVNKKTDENTLNE